MNKKATVAAILALPDVNFAAGWREPVSSLEGSTLCIAMYSADIEIAKAIFEKGVRCTETEIVALGKVYTDFLQKIAPRNPTPLQKQQIVAPANEQEPSASISEQPSPTPVDQNTIKEGWIFYEELQVDFHTWRKRWCVLTSQSLTFSYEHNLAIEPIYQVSIATIEDLEFVAPIQNRFPFRLTTSGDAYFVNLAAETEEERSQWMFSLRDAIPKAKAELTKALMRKANTDWEAERHKLQLEIQDMRTIIEEKNALLDQLTKKFQIEEQMQIQLWQFKQSLVQQINRVEDLQFISKIAHGCYSVVFYCSASHLGVPAVALKILYNFGIKTSDVHNFFSSEYEILKQLPLHINIIPIWKDFQDRPTQQFIEQFPPSLLEHVVNDVTGMVRSTTCLLMPILESFHDFFKREFEKLTITNKLAFISDIISGLMFLFENDVVHRDMKLNNLLVNPNGRIIISDFGHAKKLSPKKTVYIPPGECIGGNPNHLAPEVKINTNVLQDPLEVDYSKQPSFELGMLAFEILFGDLPDQNVFGEQMDENYFKSLPHNRGANKQGGIKTFKRSEMALFGWVRELLMADPQKRTGLYVADEHFRSIATTNFHISPLLLG